MDENFLSCEEKLEHHHLKEQVFGWGEVAEEELFANSLHNSHKRTERLKG